MESKETTADYDIVLDVHLEKLVVFPKNHIKSIFFTSPPKKELTRMLDVIAAGCTCADNHFKL